MIDLVRSAESAGESQPSDLFVGRGRELAKLVSLLDARKRSPSSALIEGEAGIGKTRLLQEFMQRARQAGYRLVRGQCYHVQEAGPYFPFVQVLREFGLGELQPEDVEATAGSALTLSVTVSPEEDAAGRRARFLRVLSHTIVRETGAAKTLLALEDVQWADVGSLLLVNDLLDFQGEDPLIVCTARMDEAVDLDARQLLARIGEKSRRILLRGLDLGALSELVETIAGPGLITEDEVRFLRSTTHGNPLFARELLLHLLETGLLERHTLPEAASRTATPQGLNFVIDLRLRSLPREVRRVLSACSVVGTEFSADLVAEALGEPEAEEAVEAELEVAASRGILQRVDSLDTSRYRFGHPLFAMRLYDSLSAGGRRRVHRQIARAAASGTIELSVSELARHHAFGSCAGGDPAALKHCEAAAEQAETVLAYEEAARFWELALRCAQRRPRKLSAALNYRLGRALWAARKWTAASEAWAKAVSLFESAGDRRQVASIALALADMHRWRNELVQSERWARRALELPLEDPLERARALALLGHIHCSRDEPDAGLSLLEEASVLAASAGGDPFVTYWLSYGYLTSGDPSKAYAIAREGLAQAERQGHVRAVAFLAGSLVHHELSQLRLDAAQAYARLLDEAIEPTDTPGLSRSLLCKVLIWGYAGKWRNVIRLCEDWMAQVRLAGRFHVATARMIWAEATLALGNPATSQEEMLKALPDLAEMRPLGALHLARALVQQGCADEATLLVHQYLERVTIGRRHTSPRALLGEIVSDLDAPQLWQRCYDSLQSETRPLLAVYSPISVRRVLGRLATRLRLWPSAIQHFDIAVRELTQGKAAWELAKTYLDYAEMRQARRRRGDLRKAAALELEAEAIFKKLRVRPPRCPRARPTPANRFALTERELAVLRLVAEGRRNSDIAETLTITSGTVQRHLENIFGKMDVGSRTQAAALASQEGLLGGLRTNR